MFEAEIAEIEKRKAQENAAVQKMEEKRAEEIERGRREVFLERSSGEIIHEPGGLPVCTSTPRMLITGRTIAFLGLCSCANDSSICINEDSR